MADGMNVEIDAIGMRLVQFIAAHDAGSAGDIALSGEQRGESRARSFGFQADADPGIIFLELGDQAGEPVPRRSYWNL